MRSSVVLPQPDGPTIMKKQPVGMSSVRLLMATNGPFRVSKTFDRPRSLIFTSGASGGRPGLAAILPPIGRVRRTHGT